MVEIERIALLDEGVRRPAGRGQRPPDQVLGAVADQRANMVWRQSGASEIGEHEVQRRGDVRGGVGKRAVQIEGDDVEGESGHSPPAIRRYGNGKLSVAF